MVNYSMKNKIIKRIQEEFNENVDLIIKEVNISLRKKVYVVYLESVTGSDKVNDYILKNLALLSGLKRRRLTDIKSLIPSPHTIVIKQLDEIEFYLTNGFTIVVEGRTVLALETKADINRSVSEPTTEQAINGPKDAFTENIQINLGLVKRRIKSHTLKSVNKVIGRKTSTMLNILYFDDIAEQENVDEVLKVIDGIDIDGITDSGILAQFFHLESNSNLPTVYKTERPDLVSTALLEGKIVILVDTSPFALILPSFFGDFINPPSDNYSIPKNINFLKVLRFACFFFTMMVPAIYIALLNFNPEAIPTSLLVNFAMQRSEVPFPTIVEALIMLVVCEILRESDYRFPNSYGSAISILGALIIGEAAVSAGIVSPIMIIIIAFTFITSLIFTDQEVTNALRQWRFLFLVLATLFGLYGIIIAFIYFLVYVTEITSLGKPYFFPLSPYEKNYLHKYLFKTKINKDDNRSPMLTKKNITKQRSKL